MKTLGSVIEAVPVPRVYASSVLGRPLVVVSEHHLTKARIHVVLVLLRPVFTFDFYLSSCLLAIFAQVSFSVTVRLNTGAPGRESGSAQK